MSVLSDLMAGLAGGAGKSVSDITSSVTKGATDIIAAAKGELTPEAKAAIQQLEVQTSTSIAQAMSAQSKAAQDFAIAYEGSATQVPKWVVVMRSMIRPLFTLFFFVILAVTVAVDFITATQTHDYSWKLLTSLPSPFWWIFGIVVTFWFGDRAASSVLESWNTGKKGV